MRYHEFVCPECEKTVHSSHRIFECPRCGYEPPIEDYKKAFADMKYFNDIQSRDLQNDVKRAFEIQAFYKSNLKALIITNIITAVLLGGSLWWIASFLNH